MAKAKDKPASPSAEAGTEPGQTAPIPEVQSEQPASPSAEVSVDPFGTLPPGYEVRSVDNETDPPAEEPTSEEDISSETHVIVSKKKLYKLLYAIVQRSTMGFSGQAGKRYVLEMLGCQTEADREELWEEIKSTNG